MHTLSYGCYSLDFPTTKVLENCGYEFVCQMPSNDRNSEWTMDIHIGAPDASDKIPTPTRIHLWCEQPSYNVSLPRHKNEKKLAASDHIIWCTMHDDHRKHRNAVASVFRAHEKHILCLQITHVCIARSTRTSAAILFRLFFSESFFVDTSIFVHRSIDRIPMNASKEPKKKN